MRAPSARRSLRGRMITDADTASTPFVAVVNEALVKKYLAGKDPLGKQINLGGKDTGMIKPFTIVGVLTDQVDRAVGGDVAAVHPAAAAADSDHVAVLPGSAENHGQLRGEDPRQHSGGAGNAFRVSRRSRRASRSITSRPCRRQWTSNTFSQRLGLYLVGSFAGLAIAMVIAGLYGVLSQLVSYRRREIGVRMALGATRQSVATLVLRQGIILIGAGLAAGLPLAFAAGRLITGFLYQVKPLDAWTYVAVALALPPIGLTAALLPARRAASIQPMQALRDE